MKVRLRDGLKSDGSLSTNQIYDVIEIDLVTTTGTTFRIVADDGTPILRSAQEFTVTDAELIGEWGVESESFGVTVAPRAFLRRYFWVEFFDGVPAARAEYGRTLIAIGAAASRYTE